MNTTRKLQSDEKAISTAILLAVPEGKDWPTFKFEMSLEDDADNMADQVKGSAGYYDTLHLMSRREVAVKAAAAVEAGFISAAMKQSQTDQAKPEAAAKLGTTNIEANVAHKRQRVLGSIVNSKAAKVAKPSQ